jgi:peptidoglycan/LPS O-acetylase OafA/YrhL
MTAATSGAIAHGRGSWRFRGDIEGLRALAVLAVLGYHAGIPWMTGGYVGVDVFFVISGFLITGLLADEFRRTGSLDLVRFYARRVRRLLPASAFALLGTAVITLVWLPINRWLSIAGDIVASALYFVNWRLANRAVDYLASDAAASPVQHFWSLSVEEQYYLIWPILIVFGLALARRTRWSSMSVVTGLIVAVLLVSVAWSLFLTATDPARAYFVTQTRVWELAIGAALALVGPKLPRATNMTGGVMAASGLALILFSIVMYSSATPFPGWLAAVPTMGAAGVLAAGSMTARHSLSRALGHPLAMWVGARSYSLYLWHWPVIVALDASVDRMTVGLGLLAVIISFLPAALSYRWVENPIRRSNALSSPRRAFPIGLVSSLLGLAAAGAIIAALGAQDSSSPKALATTASPLSEGDIPESVPDELTPSLALAAEDVPDVYDRGCHVSHGSTTATACEYGTLGGLPVVLVGDSHAAQWVPPLAEMAEERGWHFFTMSKSACPYIDAIFLDRSRGGTYDECLAWNSAVTERLVNEIKPRLTIITSRMSNHPINASGLETDGEEARQLLEDGLVRRLETLTKAGLSVAVLRDTPLPLVDVPDCLGRTGEILECSTLRSEALLTDVERRASARVNGVTFIDMTDWICTSDICPAVVDSTLVWRDQSHLSATYARQLVPSLFEQLPPVHEAAQS